MPTIEFDSARECVEPFLQLLARGDARGLAQFLQLDDQKRIAKKFVEHYTQHDVRGVEYIAYERDVRRLLAQFLRLDDQMEIAEKLIENYAEYDIRGARMQSISYDQL
jgi:Fe-S-cluster formation regulator IscX/YfhJ